MRTPIHTATALAILALCTSVSSAQAAQPDAMPAMSPATTLQQQPVQTQDGTAAAAPSSEAPQDATAVMTDSADQPDGATPATTAQQPDQGQPAGEDKDTTQSSGPITATDKIVDHFMALDTDKSDGVSFDEYMAMVQQRAAERFATMDANGDGQVTPEEYRKFWKERKAQWYRLRR
ncbi:MAG TPA: hypothetical protein VJ961_07225 [Mariprofundaceae bacterium]|nr:hypothetical protein [Mariprofundaceae bacterium]